MARLFFVHHPNNEPEYSSHPLQIIPWNCGPKHKRKLIRHDGIYLDKPNGVINYAPLYFWGEYEPYSCAHCFPTGPAVHDDLKSVRNIGITPLAKMQNTDPYVFGSRFRYICCKKRTALNPGDVVLFGNYDPKAKRFYFDTVFVCKGEKPRYIDYENQYSVASIWPTMPTKDKKFAEGKMYRDGEEMFSFVPCRVGSWDNENVEEPIRFPYQALPYVNISDFGLDNVSIRWKNIVEFNRNYWTKITDAVKEANMCLGVHLAEI